MDKRAGLRQHYQAEANDARAQEQYAKRTAQLESLEDTVVKAFNALIRFMDGKTTKTEVVNQLKSISTPDVDKVVVALSKLDKNVLESRFDSKPILDALSGLKRELSLIPKTHAPQIEQKDTIKVSNLDDVKLDTSELIKAVKALDLKVDVKAPIINTEKTDISPLKDVMLDLLKAFNKQKPIEIPEFPEIPKTDLSKVESKLDQSNKHLKEIAEKRFGGGGGGGGNGTPYTDSTGKHVNVVVNSDGSVPTGGFDPSIGTTTSIVTAGAVKTITQTDGVRTLTITIDSTDPNDKSITKVWS